MWSKIVFILIIPAIRAEYAEVNITKGRVLGLKTKTVPNGNTYYSFRGIRYAEVPRRFEPSVPKLSWKGVYKATEDKPTCIQIGFKQTNASEDCLFINVYTPSLPKDEDKLFPVMFWIYGGGFIQGNSRSSTYAPDYFIDDGVLVVTLNYRLGIFGFLSTGDVRVPGNNGMKDLVLGLRWVQENIVFFNGDPKKVTVFGESAGAAITSYLTISPLVRDKGYFIRAICQSGNALSPWAFQRRPKRNYEQVLKHTRCRYFRNLGLDLYCLRHISTSAIANIETAVVGINAVVGIGVLNGISFSPSYEVNNPGAALLEGSYALLENGSVPTVPIIMGINSEEGVAFQSALLLIKLLLLQSLFFKDVLIPDDMYASDEDKTKHIAPAIEDYYFKEQLNISSDAQIIKFISAALFNKPFRQYIKLVGNRMPQYCYVFTYVGNPSKQHPEESGISRVGHAEDLPYLWRQQNNITLSWQDLRVRDKMVRLWTNYAKYGNPTYDVENDTILDGVSWTDAFVDDTTVNCLRIDAKLEMIENPKESEYMEWYNLYQLYGHPNDTY